jgi:hypothetical protein
MNNLRIETRKKSSGFLGTGIGAKSQKTEDLVSWARKNGFGELFDKDNMINTDAANAILEGYGEKLQGQTKETLEALVELKEQYDEYLTQLHEYVSNLYAPIADNFVDSLWDWYDNGKDALDSFKEYASDTFRDIVNDMIRTIVLKNVIGTFSDDIASLYEEYSKSAGTEDDLKKLMDGVQKETSEMIGRYNDQLPGLQELITYLGDAMGGLGIDLQQPSEEGTTTQSGQSGAYSTASQDSITHLEGLSAALLEHVIGIDNSVVTLADGMATAVGHLMRIELHTGNSAEQLEKIEKRMSTMDDNIAKLYRDGIKTR